MYASDIGHTNKDNNVSQTKACNISTTEKVVPNFKNDNVTLQYVNTNYYKEEINLTRTKVIDVLSTGSITRLSYLKTQAKTWASHKSIRYFWGLTELDENDSTCLAYLNLSSYISQCKTRRRTDSKYKSASRSHLLSLDKILEKSNPEGWVCAQRRVGAGLGKRFDVYKTESQKYGTDVSLPDYLLIVDDDTYINMDMFTNFVTKKDSRIPMAYAGCLYKREDELEKNISWAFPYGGFGLFLSRASLQRMMHPLHCYKENITQEDSLDFERMACARITENRIGEQKIFRPGMSLSDIAREISMSETFCMHSDWLTAYLINYYDLSQIVQNQTYRIHPYKGNANCLNRSIKSCRKKSEICHYQTPESMKNMALL